MKAYKKLMKKYEEPEIESKEKYDLSGLTEQQSKFVKDLIELQEKNKDILRVYLDKYGGIQVDVKWGELNNVVFPDSMFILVSSYSYANNNSLYYNFQKISNIEVETERYFKKGSEEELMEIINYYKTKVDLAKDLINNNSGRIYVHFDTTYPFEGHVCSTIPFYNLILSKHDFRYYRNYLDIINNGNYYRSSSGELSSQIYSNFYEEYKASLASSITKSVSDEYGSFLVEKYDDRFIHPLNYATDEIKEYYDMDYKILEDSKKRRITEKKIKKEIRKQEKINKRVARYKRRCHWFSNGSYFSISLITSTFLI